ncbi:putative ribonuclease H-like domain-containing protein [Tanacetum coccineum]
MLAIDGVGFDWSDMAEEQVQTNMALMAFSNSEVYTDKTCSKSCLKNYEALKKQYDDLIFKLNDTEFKAATYKKGLATLEDQIVTYKKNEVLFSKEIVVLKRDVGCKEYELGVLRTELEKVKQEKEGIDFKIAKFDKFAKSLNEMLESLNEFKVPEFNGYGPRDADQETDNETSSVESPLKVEKETVIDWKEKFFYHANHVESVKLKNIEKPVKKTVSFDHMKINCPHQQRKRVVTGNNYNRVDYDYYAKTSHPNIHRHMTPRAVLLKSGLKPLNTARPIYTAHLKPTVQSATPNSYFSNQVQSTVQRPFYKKTALTNKYLNQQVNTVKPGLVNTVRPRVVNTVRHRAVNTARPYNASDNTVTAKGFNVVKPSACWGNPQLNDKGFVDSGCLRHMTGNIAYLSNFKEFDGGHVTFGGGAYGGRISGKGTLKTDNLDFEDVYFVKELKFNLFSILQMCDKKNYVLFTDTECLVLSPNFKLSDENHILLKIPRQDNMYRFDMKNIVHKESLTCLVAKATSDESMLWHRRLGHINFKNINKLVKENLVRDLPLKRFENNQTCVACLKGKQHRTSYKTKVFFLVTKDETSEILKNFIKEIENLVDNKVKIIRSDNGTEFKNKVMDDFCREKGIKREYSIARTPQQNGVVERKNRTLIKAARTMLADFKLPTTFWVEAVSTACYVQNRVLIVKPHNKTPYELFRGFKPAIGFMKPFGCHVTILNTLDNLGKFDGKSDEGFFVGYSLSSKAFRVYNTRTKKVQENLYIRSAAENLIKDKNESHDANDDTEKSNDDNNFKDDGTADQQVNTASPDVNTRSREVSTTFLEVNTATPEDLVGPSHSSEDIQVDSFNNQDNQEVDLGNIPNSYAIPTTPNIRIHKDHPIEHMIGDVWILVDLPKGHRAIGTKWVYKNKKDESGIIIRNKARLVAQGHTQEEGIDYDEVFAPVARIEAIRMFLAYASYIGFMVYQMDVKSAFLYGQIDEEHQELDDIIFGSTKKVMCDEFEKLMKDKFQMSSMEILRKFNYTDVKTASTTIDLEKPLVKHGDDDDVDVHLYRSMIGSLMYLTTSRPDVQMLTDETSQIELTHRSNTSVETVLSTTRETLENCRRVLRARHWCSLDSERDNFAKRLLVQREIGDRPDGAL